MTSTCISITVVIPTYNRCEDLKRCLSSIKTQEGVIYEVIVVDDNSSDGTVVMVEREFPEFQILRNDYNFGPSYARNIGILAAKGEYILFLDSDTVLKNSTIFVCFMKFYNERKLVGSVGGEIRAHELSSHKVYGRRICFDGRSIPVSIDNFSSNSVECDFLATCCCMVKKELAVAVGGFDPFYEFGSEDKDFGYRLTLKGFHNYLSADCSVEHYHSPRGRNPDETYRYHLTRIRFAFKHFPLHRRVLTVLSALGKILIFYLILPLKMIGLVAIRKNIISEHYVGGALLARALYLNCANYASIISSRTMDFLSSEIIKHYVLSRK